MRISDWSSDVCSSDLLPAYEVSNHARPGEESRHNLTYWRYGDYAGIGPGAHGRRGGSATVRHRKPENWTNAVTLLGHGLVEERPLSPADRARAALLRRSEEHTSELQSLMRISYAVFCLKTTTPGLPPLIYTDDT